MPGIHHKLFYFHLHSVISSVICIDVLSVSFTCYHNRVLFIMPPVKERE